ncbi:MAG: sugar kinase [Chthoniobacteraceae bacterium]
MPHVVTFGEIMLRLTTPGYERFAQATSLDVTFGGAEANVAVAIAQLGGTASFITKLPDHELGQRAIDELQRCGVYTAHVIRGGERLGVYFLEQGASQRPGKVIYDRAGSAIAEADLAEFNWPAIFDGADWFHWSGITAALSPGCAKTLAAATACAKSLGLTVSFDMNYRAKLWSPARASMVLTPLMEHVDICVCGISEAVSVFDIEADGDEAVAAALAERFGFGTVAIPQRQSSSASHARFGALLRAGEDTYASRRHEITVVDRVGTGDAFTGGLIFSLLRGDAPHVAIDFAVAAGVLAHTIPGDLPLFSLAEVEALAGGADGGRVQR